MLRARHNVVPIIMLTALRFGGRTSPGLEAGADDYVTKPFGLAELRSRIRAVLRRASGHIYDEAVFQAGRVRLDHGRREVSVGDEPVNVTFSEFEILSTLIANPAAPPLASMRHAIWATAPSAIPAVSTYTSATCARSLRSRPSARR